MGKTSEETGNRVVDIACFTLGYVTFGISIGFQEEILVRQLRKVHLKFRERSGLEGKLESHHQL